LGKADLRLGEDCRCPAASAKACPTNCCARPARNGCSP